MSSKHYALGHLQFKSCFYLRRDMTGHRYMGHMNLTRLTCPMQTIQNGTPFAGKRFLCHLLSSASFNCLAFGSKSAHFCISPRIDFSLLIKNPQKLESRTRTRSQSTKKKTFHNKEQTVRALPDRSRSSQTFEDIHAAEAISQE